MSIFTSITEKLKKSPLVSREKFGQLIGKELPKPEEPKSLSIELNLTTKDKSLIDEGMQKLWKDLTIPQKSEKIVKGITGLAKSVAQETAKSGAALTLELQAGAEQLRHKLFGVPLTEERQKREFELGEGASELEKKAHKTIFGEGKLVGFGKRGEEVLESFGAKKLAEGKTAPYLIGAGITLMDFTTGGGKSNVIRVLTKTNKVDDVVKILKGTGMADDLIKSYAPIIAKTSKVEEVGKIVNRLEDLQKTTKVAVKGVKGLTGKVSDFPTGTGYFIQLSNGRFIRGFPTQKDAQVALQKILKGEEVPYTIVKGVKEVKPEIAKGFKWTERGFITSIKEELPELKVAGQYVPRSTDRLAIKAANEIKFNLAGAEKMALTGTSDEAIATGAELLKHYNEEALKATSRATKNALYDKAGELANTMARNLTEQGRSVQAASILGRLTPEGQLRFAAREIQKYNEEIEKTGKGLLGLKKKVPELTGEQSQKIINEMNTIKAMPEGTEKAMRFQKLQNYISDLVPSTLMSKVIAVWKAGLLTGIKTSGLNIFSNISHFGSEIIKDVPAKAVDSVVSLFTGKETIGLTLKGTRVGIKEGFGKGIRYLKTGFDERNIGVKLDWKRVNFGKGKIAKGLQRYEETIFRIMGTEDQPFYYGAKARSLYDQAIAQASNKGLKGLEKQKFINGLVESPTEDMLKYAIKDAETVVYQQQTLLGKAARGIQKIPGGEFVVPFGRTPSAVATQIINYSPAGIVKTIIQNIGKGKFDQRLFAQGLGRGLTGTGALYIGYELGKKGLIALDRPTGEREQKLWELEGRKPNSIKIGGKWQSPIVLGPAGNLLLIGAHFQKAFQESGSPTEALSKGTLSSVKSFSEQTFLTGINQITNALTDPDRFVASYPRSLLSSTIPTIVGDVAKAIDPKERRSEALLDGIIAKIPVLRETLEPRISVLGEEVERPGNIIETMIDPMRPQKVITTPLIAEFRRLTNGGFKISPTLLGDKKGYSGLTPEQNTELWKRAGEITESKLNNLIKLEEYLKEPDDKRAKLIESITDKSKLVARVEMVINLTNELSGEELKNKLSKLKKSGLMTREVFDNYLKLR